MPEEKPLGPEIPGTVVAKVYDDALSPSARTLGKSLERVVRTALRPVDGVVWSMDQAFDWVSSRVALSLVHRGVREADIVPPPIEVEARVLRGLQVAGLLPDPTLRNLFAELLATSMHATRVTEAHPAFAEALAQMVPDEARIMCILGSEPFTLVRLEAEGGCVRLRSGRKVYLGYDPNIPQVRLAWRPLETEARIQNPDHLDYYLANLRRLGLAESSRLDDLGDLKFSPYSTLREEVETEIARLESACPDTHKAAHSIIVEVAEGTLWGAAFRRACGTGQFYDREQGWLTTAWR